MNPTSDLMGMIQVQNEKKMWDKNKWTALIFFVGAVKTLMGSYRNKYPKIRKASHYISMESIHDRVAL